jgi:voltage-gated potassium channel
MEHQTAPNWFGRRLQRRVQRKGMTPRIAAGVIALFWGIGVVVFGIVERLVDPDTFDTVWLGMWWGVQTVTTVGYGDVVPGDVAGKVIATFLMFGGLSLFAVVTGAITSSFVAQAQQRMGHEDPVMKRLDEVGAQLDAISAELARLKETSD